MEQQTLVQLRKKEGRGKFLTVILVPTLLRSLYWLYIDIYFNIAQIEWQFVKATSIKDWFYIYNVYIYWRQATFFLSPFLIIGIWYWKKIAVNGLFFLWLLEIITSIVIFHDEIWNNNSNGITLFLLFLLFWAARRKWHLFS